MKHKDRGIIYCNSIESLVGGLRTFLTCIHRADAVTHDPVNDRRYTGCPYDDNYIVYSIDLIKGGKRYRVEVDSAELRKYSFAELLLICQERYEAIQNG